MGFDMSSPLEPSNQNYAGKWAYFITAVLSPYENEQAHENEDILVFHTGFIE